MTPLELLIFYLAIYMFPFFVIQSCKANVPEEDMLLRRKSMYKNVLKNQPHNLCCGGLQVRILVRANKMTYQNIKSHYEPILTNPWQTSRSNRRMARQRSFANKGSSSGAISSPMETRSVSSSETSNAESKKLTVTTEGMFNFCTPDNKRLRELLRKDLQSSDVGYLKRIVLPKRAVEENLPPLSHREGMDLLLRDVYSNNQWQVRFRFWTNNKSRMYVLESTGHFVRENHMQAGDFLVLYEDVSKNLYFSVIKRAIHTATPYVQLDKQVAHNHRYRSQPGTNASSAQKESQAVEDVYISQPPQAKDENASLAFFMNQFAQNEPREENSSLDTLPKDVASFPCSIKEETNKSPPTPDPTGVPVDFPLDDCYTDLGLLPEVNKYGFFSDDPASHSRKL